MDADQNHYFEKSTLIRGEFGFQHPLWKSLWKTLFTHL